MFWCGDGFKRRHVQIGSIDISGSIHISLVFRNWHGGNNRRQSWRYQRSECWASLSEQPRWTELEERASEEQTVHVRCLEMKPERLDWGSFGVQRRDREDVSRRMLRCELAGRRSRVGVKRRFINESWSFVVSQSWMETCDWLRRLQMGRLVTSPAHTSPSKRNRPVARHT